MGIGRGIRRKKPQPMALRPGCPEGHHPMNREGVNKGEIHPRRAAGFFIPGSLESPPLPGFIYPTNAHRLTMVFRILGGCLVIQCQHIPNIRQAFSVLKPQTSYNMDILTDWQVFRHDHSLSLTGMPRTDGQRAAQVSLCLFPHADFPVSFTPK